MRQSPTSPEIQRWVRKEHGFVPKDCWIAHCKEIHGLPLAANRDDPAVPCSPEKVVTEAFRHFGMV